MGDYTSTGGPTLSNPSPGNPEPDGLVQITAIAIVGIKEVKINSPLSVNFGTRDLGSWTISPLSVVLYVVCLTGRGANKWQDVMQISKALLGACS